MPEIRFECRTPTREEHETTVNALRDHTQAQTGRTVSHIPFGLLAHDRELLVGSVIGKVFFNWLHLDLVWVHEDYRRRGIGRQLMINTARQADAARLSGIEVWTQSWQAPEFYLATGFEPFAVLDDFFPGAKRYAFRRYLVQAEPSL